MAVAQGSCIAQNGKRTCLAEDRNRDEFTHGQQKGGVINITRWNAFVRENELRGRRLLVQEPAYERKHARTIGSSRRVEGAELSVPGECFQGSRAASGIRNLQPRNSKKKSER